MTTPSLRLIAATGLIIITGLLNSPQRSNAREGQGQVIATIAGLKNQNGQLCLTLFAQENGFPNEANGALSAQCIQTHQAASGITFENLRPGDYAIAVFHDANDDGKLNTGFLGIPKEGFGFSQNPRIGMSAPRFQDAAFSLTHSKAQVKIQMKYF